MAKRRSRRKRRSFFSFRTVRGFVLLLSLLLGVGGGFFLRGKVVSVSDGDTITVLTKGGSLQKIRLYGVDCPEAAQPGGREAASFTSDLALFQEARLDTVNIDQYGRAVALVTLPDGRSLNRELVAAGHAWVYRQYCKKPVCISWAALEAGARGEKRGLWRQSRPQPPWKWRAAKRP